MYFSVRQKEVLRKTTPPLCPSVLPSADVVLMYFKASLWEGMASLQFVSLCQLDWLAFK